MSYKIKYAEIHFPLNTRLRQQSTHIVIKYHWSKFYAYGFRESALLYHAGEMVEEIEAGLREPGTVFAAPAATWRRVDD